jgi:DNA-binding winged helix-turn-helix (wHTH) protein
MIKICILSENETFAQDLAQQFEKELQEIATTFYIKEDNINMVFADEKEDFLSSIATNAEVGAILLSSDKISSNYADLIIKKPFSLNQLLKKIKTNTLLPRIRRRECINFKEYSLYPIKKEIIINNINKTIKLTEREVEIIKFLYQNPSGIVTKEDLLEKVWGYSAEATTHTIETHIYRLRQKVEQEGGSQLIITENNGYRLNM